MPKGTFSEVAAYLLYLFSLLLLLFQYSYQIIASFSRLQDKLSMICATACKHVSGHLYESACASAQSNQFLHCLLTKSLDTNWVTACKHVSSGICGQQRPTSASVFAQSDQGFHCPLTEYLNSTECMNGEQRPE